MANNGQSTSSTTNNTNQKKQARYWICTTPYDDFKPSSDSVNSRLAWLFGQAELSTQGYKHWQFVAYFSKPVTLSIAKNCLTATTHCEPTRSQSAIDYVRKEDTKIAGSEFEFGTLPVKRNSSKDWDSIWSSAQNGQLLEIPSDVRIRCYTTFKRICKDYQSAPIRENVVSKVFWGKSGTGKSHLAFSEAGTCYIKGSTTKWWDGYKGESNVILDEFRGQISIEHVLKWLDKWPCFVEEKGGQIALKATNFWICSNLSPTDWYPDIDPETLAALLRRLTVTHFENPFQ